jgi:Flp pilus assembly protein TadD
MISKFFKIIFIIISFFFANQANSKNIDYNFNKSELSNYLSAIISFNNHENEQSLNYFNSSKRLLRNHENYLKQYVFSLVVNQKVKRAIQEIKVLENKENVYFFESYVLLSLDSILKKKYKNSEKYINYLSKFKNQGPYEKAIFNTLKIYTSTFKNKKLSFQKSNFENLDLLNNTFLKCYLNDTSINASFDNLINSASIDYSRYLFFYANYLLHENKKDEAKKLFLNQDPLNSGLLLLQTKDWLINNQTKKITSIFSCKSEKDLLAEFFFLISNLYATQGDLVKSNFYLGVSNFLNNKFKANKLLAVENYYNLGKFDETKKILNNFTAEDKMFYWFKVKTNTKIIASMQNKDQALNYVENEFKKIKKKSDKINFDMANIYKNYKKYNKAIILYSELMENFEKNSDNYAGLLFRRGGSNERLGNYKKSDKDLLLALKISPNDSYTLNYLAYSWLERKMNISKAVKMLEIANKINENDPYITDSVGWGYFLTGRYDEAEKFMRRAIILMPNDPVINDHYGDILWKLNKKLQAKFYWESVLNLEDTEDDMIEKVKIKLLKGLKIESNSS